MVLSVVFQNKTTGSSFYCYNKDNKYLTVDMMSVNFETALHNVTDSIYVSHGVDKSNSLVSSYNLE